MEGCFTQADSPKQSSHLVLSLFILKEKYIEQNILETTKNIKQTFFIFYPLIYFFLFWRATFSWRNTFPVSHTTWSSPPIHALSTDCYKYNKTVPRCQGNLRHYLYLLFRKQPRLCIRRKYNLLWAVHWACCNPVLLLPVFQLFHTFMYACPVKWESTSLGSPGHFRLDIYTIFFELFFIQNRWTYNKNTSNN